MAGQTFAEKILGASAGTIVFKKPDIVLSHDNTASIARIFTQINGKKIKDPEQILVVLNHSIKASDEDLKSDYILIRDLVKTQNIDKFHDIGQGICHQIVSYYAQPGQIIVGSDSHTATAGAFNAFAMGIGILETAGLWKHGETWFKVPQSMKITLNGKLKSQVYAKDLAMWIIGLIGTSAAGFMSIEFHGKGVELLSISDRMTIANMAAEMGVKNAVFPADSVLIDFLGKKVDGIWADNDAVYEKELVINLNEVFPLVAAPHSVDNVKSVSQVQGTMINMAIIGTCTNGRIEDLRMAAEILKGRKVSPEVQLHINPASQMIYLLAEQEGLIQEFIRAGAKILPPSCGSCLGSGSISTEGYNIISTANRNYSILSANPKSNIYLASPATVAMSAVEGYITDPRGIKKLDVYPFTTPHSSTAIINAADDRYKDGVWNYADVDNLSANQMFAESITLKILCSEVDKIIPHLFEGFDPNFKKRAKANDIIIAGSEFGQGSFSEHPAAGLANLGIRAIIVKSVNRNFYRSAINMGLPVIVLREAVDAFNTNDKVDINFEKGQLTIGDNVFMFSPLPKELMKVFEVKGLLNYLKNT